MKINKVEFNKDEDSLEEGVVRYSLQCPDCEKPMRASYGGFDELKGDLPEVKVKRTCNCSNWVFKFEEDNLVDFTKEAING